MPLIVTLGNGELVVRDTNPDRVTGRWCKAPKVPDLCYRCFDPETLAHYSAEGYTEDDEGWRYGTCHRWVVEDGESEVEDGSEEREQKAAFPIGARGGHPRGAESP